MKTRRTAFMVVMALVLVAGAFFLAGCSGAKYEDGVYFAQEDNFSPGNGWKYMVTLTVDGGKITAADWNGANIKAGDDKKTSSQAGHYPMVANGGAQSDWHVQAEAAEAWLLKKQDPTAIEYIDEEGHVDSISGVSIHVVEFFSLAEKALAAGPSGSGMYKDGSYHAEMPEFAGSGWKYIADFTVVNGYIVAVNWDGVFKDGGDTKKVVSEAGNYPMVANGGAQADWHIQAAETEAYFLAEQGIAPAFKDDATDAIAGVSVKVKDLYTLAAEVLPKR